MDTKEADASFRILVAVARADGHIAVDEERALAILAGLDSARAIDGQVDVAKEAARIRTPEIRRATYDAALALASVDGQCTKEEHALLTQLRAALGITDGDSVEVAEAKWLDTMRAPLADLSDMEVRFLRAVALEREDMTDHQYAALVSDFSRRRRDVLEEALRPAALA